MADLGTLELTYRTKLDQLDKDMAKAKSKAGKAADEMGEEMERRLGAKMQGVGKTLTKTLTPAAGAAGGAFGLAFKEFDAGADILISKTGASGKALEGLEGSMKKVAGGVTSGFGDIGSVVGDLNTALGITGKPLEDLTGRIVKLQELGESFDTMSFTRFLGDWSISSDDAGAALDRLYKTGQVTGIGVGQLMDMTVQFGAPMRALGFSVDDSTALIAKFAKEGVNTEAVLAGMKVGLGKMAKAGEEPQATFNRLVSEIKGATTEGQAFGLAAEAFGSRAGPDLAMAIREGRFGVDELKNSVADSAGSIETSHQATLDWSDKLEMLKNKAIGVVGPVGEIGMAVAGLAMGVGPAMMAIGKIGPALAGAALGAGKFALSMISAGISAAAAAIPVLIAWAPVILAVAAVAAAAYLIYRNWDTIKEKVGEVVGAVAGFLSNLLGGIVNFVQEWGILLLGPIGAIWKFRDQIGEAIAKVVDFFLALPGKIIDALSSLAGRLWDAAWEAMVRMSVAFNQKRDELLGWFGELPGKIIGALGDLGRRLYDLGWDAIQGLWNGLKDRAGAVLGWAADLGGKVIGAIGKVIGWGSPATEFIAMGKDSIEGLMIGLKAHEGQLARQLVHIGGMMGQDGLGRAVANMGNTTASYGHSSHSGDGPISAPGGGPRPIGPFNFYNVRQDDLPTEIPRRLRGALHMWDR